MDREASWFCLPRTVLREILSLLSLSCCSCAFGMASLFNLRALTGRLNSPPYALNARRYIPTTPGRTCGFTWEYSWCRYHLLVLSGVRHGGSWSRPRYIPTSNPSWVRAFYSPCRRSSLSQDSNCVIFDLWLIFPRRLWYILCSWCHWENE